MFQTEVVDKMITHILCAITYLLTIMPLLR